MWKKTIGHEKQIERLQKMLMEKRVAHAHLFTGMEGIGKKRLAIGLAQALNCAHPSVPCETCPSCTKIAKGIHPDCYFVQPDGRTIKVEVIRELKQKIVLHPLEGHSKVVLIDKADAMTDTAANALLKILEEPPGNTYFILISSQPSKLPSTIRSRCQRLEFSPLNEERLLQYLTQSGLSGEEAKEKAKYGEGSLEAALAFDGHSFREVQNQVENLKLQPHPSRIFELSESWSEEADRLPSILTFLAHLWRQKTRDAGSNAAQTLAAQWTAIQEAKRSLETYANKQLLLENLLFTLCAS